MAVSAAGDFAVSGGADRSLRVWRRTDEPFFVEEERERRLESMFEADAEVRQRCRGGLSGMRVCRDDKQQWLRYVIRAEASTRTQCVD